MQEPRRHRSPQQPPEPELDRGGVEQVAAADHQVDAVARVVHDHAERVRPVADAVADQQVAVAGRLVGHRPRQQVHPAFRARPDGHPQARAPVLGERPVPAPARAPDPAPRPPVLGLPGRERRPRAVAGVDEALLAEPRQRRLVDRPRIGLAVRRRAAAEGVDRTARPATSPSRSRSSSSAASCSGRDRCRSWSSIRRTTRPPVARARPHVYSALTRWPRWSRPVGAGAKRVTGADGRSRRSGRAAATSPAGRKSGCPLGVGSADSAPGVVSRTGRHGSGRDAPRCGWRRRSAGRWTAGRPATAARGWPSRRAAAPRARAPGPGAPCGPRRASPGRRRGRGSRAR